MRRSEREPGSRGGLMHAWGGGGGGEGKGM